MSREIMGGVNNGARVAVSLPDFEGVAGFVEASDGTAQLSYRSNGRAGARPGATIEADGRRWEVVKVGPSEFVRAFSVMTLKPVAADEEGAG